MNTFTEGVDVLDQVLLFNSLTETVNWRYSSCICVIILILIAYQHAATNGGSIEYYRARIRQISIPPSPLNFLKIFINILAWTKQRKYFIDFIHLWESL